MKLPYLKRLLRAVPLGCLLIAPSFGQTFDREAWIELAQARESAWATAQWTITSADADEGARVGKRSIVRITPDVHWMQTSHYDSSQRITRRADHEELRTRTEYPNRLKPPLFELQELQGKPDLHIGSPYTFGWHFQGRPLGQVTWSDFKITPFDRVEYLGRDCARIAVQYGNSPSETPGPLYRLTIDDRSSGLILHSEIFDHANTLRARFPNRTEGSVRESWEDQEYWLSSSIAVLELGQFESLEAPSRTKLAIFEESPTSRESLIAAERPEEGHFAENALVLNVPTEERAKATQIPGSGAT